MKTPRKKHAGRVGRPRRTGLAPAVQGPTIPVSSPPSLPLADSGPTDAASPPSTELKPYWQLPEDSPQRTQALVILGLRGQGLTDAEIAAQLGLAPKSISNLIHRAAKNGWLTEDAALVNPKDDLEYRLSHKALRNIEQALDSDDPALRAKATFKVADAVLFPSFAAAAETPPQLQAVAITINMPDMGGVMPTVREGATAGVPSFVDGQIVQ